MKSLRSTLTALALASSLCPIAACSGSHVASDVDAEIDTPDGGRPDPDAGVRPDTGPPLDAGDPPIDAGPLDLDRDGVPAASDCDDDDPAVGATSARECSSSCGVGTERCMAGVWSACDAPTDCACSVEGMTRTVPCGRCGLASQRCEGGTWSMPSACLSEGECFAGELETERAMCGERSRICDDTCAWRAWTVLTPPGECEAGVVRTTDTGCGPGTRREETCSATCAWEVTGECSLRCARPPHPSRTGADPVCIPAGPFVLGRDGGTQPELRPERSITMSEYYVDRYPITKARFELCRAAGACTVATHPMLADEYDALSPEHYAAYLLPEAALAFCEWDGGRLISEYEWEKAARGSAPDRRFHSWGDLGPDDCSTRPNATCPLPVRLAAFPAAVSPYGVRLLGSVPEHTRTWWGPDHSAVAAVDPEGPASAMYRVTRGQHWGSTSHRIESALRRGNGHNSLSAVRCVY